MCWFVRCVVWVVVMFVYFVTVVISCLLLLFGGVCLYRFGLGVGFGCLLLFRVLCVCCLGCVVSSLFFVITRVCCFGFGCWVWCLWYCFVCCLFAVWCFIGVLIGLLVVWVRLFVDCFVV